MWAILDYRFRRWLLNLPKLIRLLLWTPAFFGHISIECLTGISIPTGCRVGKGLYIGHFSGIFLNDGLVMGEDCNLSQGVVIGVGGKDQKLGIPTVGDRVYFGPGSKVFGKITIGSDVRIGANAVVLDSVPDGRTAVGIPAQIVPKH